MGHSTLHLRLQIILQPYPFDHTQLLLQPVGVIILGVFQQRLQNLAGLIILHRFAKRHHLA